MTLKSYRDKRNLAESGEPRGRVVKHKPQELRFVVQKHDASHLHYDFRLEAEGVLKSWAVPKGPSMDPSVKRLAMRVEDHPYDYRNFEGVIPKGYGAGTVMIWDEGTYTVEGESGAKAEELIQKGLEKGGIHFTLEGRKLKGDFSLVKLKDKEKEWLLIKKKDRYSTKEDIALEALSVVSQRSMEEIASTAGKGKLLVKHKGKAKQMPHLVKPMLATLVDHPFDSEEWIFEIKWDGYRALAELQGAHIELYSRNFLSFNQRYPTIVSALQALDLHALLDGEIVALDQQGHSSFQMLQNSATSADLYYYVFDLLHYEGKDLTGLTLIERKKILKRILPEKGRIRYAEHIETRGNEFYQLCVKQGLEGMIAKQKESRYHPGMRSKEWVKVKADLRQEVVICGFTRPRGSRKHFGALIVGVYEQKELKYAGHVGGGFDEAKLKELYQLFELLITSACPFKVTPTTNMPVTWIKPRLLCEVKFKEWTDEGSMRQPIFIGMRMDKPPKTVKREKPLAVEEVTHPREFLTHLDKLYWEKEKISKGDLINYYQTAGEILLPYLVDRPESLRRFPNGISKPSFFQKNLEVHPDWIQTVTIEHSSGNVHYLLIQDLDSLLYAVNLGCIEIHPWFSKVESLDNPDFMVMDLDPEDIDFEAVIETALVLHELFEQFKVPNYCKTSGSRGLHICVPLAAKYTYEQAKHFAQWIAALAHQKLPKTTSLERSPKDRQKKVYIDCLQNNYGQTLAAPYSVRAKPGAPVSTPLEWKELKKGLKPTNFTIFNIMERIKKKGDLFKGVLGKGIDLAKVLEST